MKRNLIVAAAALALLATSVVRADTAQEELQPGFKRAQATSYQASNSVSNRAAQNYDFLNQANP
jgi:hypothetical protein